MYRPTLTITVNNAATVLDAGLRAIASGQTKIDFSDVTAFDSAAVATLLAWQRAARSANKELLFINVPANLQSLIQLYGVTEFLPVGATVPARADLLHH